MNKLTNNKNYVNKSHEDGVII